MSNIKIDQSNPLHYFWKQSKIEFVLDIAGCIPSKIKFYNIYHAYSFYRAKYFNDQAFIGLFASAKTCNFTMRRLPMNYNHEKWKKIRINVLMTIIRSAIKNKHQDTAFRALLQKCFGDKCIVPDILDTDKELSHGKTRYCANKVEGENIYGKALARIMEDEIVVAALKISRIPHRKIPMAFIGEILSAPECGMVITLSGKKELVVSIAELTPTQSEKIVDFFIWSDYLVDGWETLRKFQPASNQYCLLDCQNIGENHIIDRIFLFLDRVIPVILLE